MNSVLWAAQIVLAIKLFTVTYTHGLLPDQAKMQRGIDRFGAATRPLLILIASCVFLGAFGLVLPAATGTLTWLTPWAAALVAAMMLVSIGFHAACRDKPKVVVSIVLCALAAFVAYGRWVIAPF